MITIRELKQKKIPGGTSLFVSFDFNRDVVDLIKSCTPFNYDKKTHTWEIPLTRLAKFVNTASKFDNIQFFPQEVEVAEDKQYNLQQYKTKPYKHQIEGIQHGLNHDKWLLLDAPGLGKTLQIIDIAEELKSRYGIQHCLIICGVNSLKINWAKEIKLHSNLDCKILGEKFTKNGKQVFEGTASKLKDLTTSLKEFFIITNIESLRDDKITAQLLAGKNKFDMMVVDEIHVCKSPQSQQGKNLLKLTKSKYRIGLTGTLLLNSPLDCYVPMKWIGKENCTYSNFKYQYCNFGGPFGNEIVGYRNIDFLKEQLSECSLRRTKDLIDLPEKTIIDEYLDMSPSQELFYHNIENGILEQVDKVDINTTTLLSMVTRLRQATSCPSVLTSENIQSIKLQRCKELIEEIVGNGEKVVIFSGFKQSLYDLSSMISKHNPLICSGDVPDNKIAENIEMFQTDEEHKVFLCTWQKIGTGFTLNRAHYGIFIDPPWTSGQAEQAEDRIHRIGSKLPVFIYYLWTNNTFDLRVQEILRDKGIMSDYVIDDKVPMSLLPRLKQLILDMK